MNPLRRNTPPVHPGRWTDAYLDAYRLVGDVDADAAVARILKDPNLTASQFFQQLVRNDAPVPADLPGPIAHYFADTAWPAFADPQLVARGQQLFTKWGPQICLSLFCASLPIGYSADRIVRVLHSIGRLETDALRRVFETAQFLFDVMDEGGLGPEGKGIRAAQRVRLMHAGVRHLITAADTELENQSRIDGRAVVPLWPVEWGKPLNQEDLAGTLLTFTVVVIDSLAKLGVRLNAGERAAYLHTWRVIGHFMGIMDEMLPVDEADARSLWAAQERRQLYRPSVEGRHMTTALLGAFDDLVPGRMFDFIGRGLVCHLSGRARAAVGVHPLHRVGRAAFAAYMGVNRLCVRAQQRHPHILNVTGRFQRDLIHGLVNHKPANFAVPDRLRDHWQLDIPAALKIGAPEEDRTPVGRV
jgi:hypothetical protein